VWRVRFTPPRSPVTAPTETRKLAFFILGSPFSVLHSPPDIPRPNDYNTGTNRTHRHGDLFMHAEAHGHEPSLAELEHVFTDAEWQVYRTEDLRAGTAVVSLMLGIFGMGVILYSIVLFTL
jgi:hypothetical protein